MPEPVMDREKNACPMAMTQVSALRRYSHLGMKRKRYPSAEPSRKNTLTARIIKRPKKAGISTLLTFSIPLVAPAISRTQAVTTTARWHGMLPKAEDISPKNAPESTVNRVPVSPAPRVRSTQPRITE